MRARAKFYLLMSAFICSLHHSFCAAFEPISKPATKEQLSPEDQKIIRRGEVSKTRYIVGGAVGSLVGFGIGHTIQGSWRDNGKIFTIAESSLMGTLFIVSFSAIAYDRNTGEYQGRRSHEFSDVLSALLLGFVGLRVWEIVDVWTEPLAHNRKYHDLQMKSESAITPAIGLTGDQHLTVGLRYTF